MEQSIVQEMKIPMIAFRTLYILSTQARHQLHNGGTKPP
jgi:hypothetical protein